MKLVPARSLLPFALSLASALHPSASGAATVRCVTSEGRVLYQDTRCPEDATARPVDDTPNSGFRFAEQRDIARLNRPAPEIAERPLRGTRVKRVRPRFDATERRMINTGAHVAEVRKKIGPPDQIVRMSTTSEKRSKPDPRQRWIYLPTDDDPQTTTILTVIGGLVLHVDRKVTR